jgi:glycosyltransferase involved in cell wall biosynthesis
MKLIVTIPAFNEEENIAAVIREIPRQIPGVDRVEVLVYDDGSRDRTVELARAAGADHVLSHPKNKGLATTFKDALWAALQRGADIIVNTDGDNHYDQSRIPDLIAPILAGRAQISIGSRRVAELEHMPFWNKHLNQIGSLVMTRWVGLPKLDVSTGYRAYTREAALKLGVYSNHTYVHTTLLSARDWQLDIVEVPIMARQVTRKSRLIKNIPDHLVKASVNIIRNVALFRPLRFFGPIAVVLFLVGAGVIGRFLYFVVVADGRGHIQSLILAVALILLSAGCMMLGLLGSSIGWTRKTAEEALYLLKKRELEDYLTHTHGREHP